jgi:hypothetical protein
VTSPLNDAQKAEGAVAYAWWPPRRVAADMTRRAPAPPAAAWRSSPIRRAAGAPRMPGANPAASIRGAAERSVGKPLSRLSLSLTVSRLVLPWWWFLLLVGELSFLWALGQHLS